MNPYKAGDRVIVVNNHPQMFPVPLGYLGTVLEPAGDGSVWVEFDLPVREEPHRSYAKNKRGLHIRGASISRFERAERGAFQKPPIDSSKQ